MTKYKLIQIYPGGPKTLGLEIKLNGSFYQSSFCKPGVEHFHEDKRFFNPKDYPNHWEKIKEKDYEILSFKLHQHCIAKLGFDGLYHTVSNDQIGKSEEMMLRSDYNIHSVKRLSDGEVFTVGDEIKTCVSDSYASIYGFKISDSGLEINHTHSYLLNKQCPGTPSNCHLYLISKKKKPLFISEDGKEIYLEDTPFSLERKTGRIYNDGTGNNYYTSNFTPNPKYAYFSSLEAMYEYIMFHQQKLSLNDLIECWEIPKEEVVQSKLFKKFKQKVLNK